MFGKYRRRWPAHREFERFHTGGLVNLRIICVRYRVDIEVPIPWMSVAHLSDSAQDGPVIPLGLAVRLGMVRRRKRILDP